MTFVVREAFALIIKLLNILIRPFGGNLSHYLRQLLPNFVAVETKNSWHNICQT
jgi:hypothetical protein